MQYIILLRGINVGGRRIKMAELRACFQEAGYPDVATVLQTGNVILESNKDPDKLKQETEKLLEQTFDYPVKVLALTTEQLLSVIENYPFEDHGPEFHRYAVFTDPENVATMTEANEGKLDESIEAVEAGEGIVYWRVLKGKTLKSDFGKYMTKAASKHFMTSRNLNTLEKILKKCG